MSLTQQTRVEFSAKEAAAMIGCSVHSLKKPKYYRRYGGKKRDGRIVFSAAALEAIRDGKL